MPTETPKSATPSRWLPCPAPGIYPGIDFDTYTRWDALNHSTLKRIAQSPAHYQYHREHRTDCQTTSKRRGTAIHELLLEPERFDRRVLLGPINESTGKCYGDTTKAWGEFEARNPGRMILTEDEMDSMRSLLASVQSHPDLGPLLAAEGDCEVCIVWEESITGLRCKARIDKRVRTSRGNIRLDLKSCLSADDGALERSLVDYGYGTQDAFYARGCKALGLDDISIFAALETEQPHGIRVFRVGQDSAKAFDELVYGWLHRVSSCQQTGVWPGYDTGVMDVNAPLWWLKRYAEASE